jgi:hypothetical protein
MSETPAMNMDAGITPARQARAQYRHELQTLTYVTLDQANGGIVRNLTKSGIGAQVVAAVRPQQQLRLRFELRHPRLQVETPGEVVWSTFSGQCGIRFLDMPASLQQQINQWIFGNLLEGLSLHTEQAESILAPGREPAPESEDQAVTNRPTPGEVEKDDGLMVTPAAVKIIALPGQQEPAEPAVAEDDIVGVPQPPPSAELGWLSQPLSRRALAWTVDVLVVMSSLLLFALVFLSVAREAPPWPLAGIAGAALMMAGLYWIFFRVFAGSSLGAQLARIAETDSDGDGAETRFR